MIELKGREIVKDIMDKKGISNATLAHRMNVSIATMWDRVNSKKVKDIPLSTLSEMLRQLDYKIVIVPASKQIKSDEYIVDEAQITEKGDTSSGIEKTHDSKPKGKRIRLTSGIDLDELLGK